MRFILIVLLILLPVLLWAGPIHHAASKGDRDTLERLLQENPQLIHDKNEGGVTPLGEAAYHSQNEVARLLIEKGADVNAKKNDGSTPLHDAAFRGNSTLARLLIEKGANVNAKFHNEQTPLHFAAHYGHPLIAELLIEKGAAIDAKREGGWTPLHEAADRGNTAVVKLLIEKGADPNAKNDDGKTPLDQALAKGQGHIAVAEALLTPIRVTLELNGASIQDALKQLFAMAKLNYSVDDSVQGTIAVHLMDVPFPLALKTLLRSANGGALSFTIANGIYKIIGKQAENIPPERTVNYLPLAKAAVDDLLKHFWVGDVADANVLTGHITNILVTPNRPTRPLLPWGRATFVSVLENLHQVTKDPKTRQRIALDWSYFKGRYTLAQRQACGEGTLNPASDDSGFTAVMYLNIHRALRDPEALADAEGLFTNAWNRWKIGQNAEGGLGFTDNRRNHRSSVNFALIWTGIRLYELTGNRLFLERAKALYDWNEKHLLRGDSLYWCIYLENGPERNAVPNGEGTSDTFLGGNMGMGVIHARLYRITGEAVYKERALRTADAIAAHETDGKGHYLNDRDAWANGYFIGEWAREVLTLQGCKKEHADLLRRTALAIQQRARTADGLYRGCWNGTEAGKECAWETYNRNEPTFPQQIMTSSNAVNVIVAAAQLQNLGL